MTVPDRRFRRPLFVRDLIRFPALAERAEEESCTAFAWKTGQRLGPVEAHKACLQGLTWIFFPPVPRMKALKQKGPQEMAVAASGMFCCQYQIISVGADTWQLTTERERIFGERPPLCLHKDYFFF